MNTMVRNLKKVENGIDISLNSRYYYLIFKIIKLKIKSEAMKMVHKKTLDSFACLMQTNRYMQDQMKDWLHKYKLTFTEYSVLQVLHQKGRQSVQQISKSVWLTSGSMTYVIDRLQEKGYLSRSDCKEDRRVVFVTITNAGKELMDLISPYLLEKISTLFQQTTEEEQQLLIDILHKITQNKLTHT